MPPAAAGSGSCWAWAGSPPAKNAKQAAHTAARLHSFPILASFPGPGSQALLVAPLDQPVHDIVVQNIVAQKGDHAQGQAVDPLRRRLALVKDCLLYTSRCV